MPYTRERLGELLDPRGALYPNLPIFLNGRNPRLLPGGLLRHALGGALFGACLGLSHTLLFAEASARCGPRRTEAVGLIS